MTTNDLRQRYGKKCWFNCKDGDEAFTDGYVMWLERQIMKDQTTPFLCKCGNELTDKEIFYDTCLKCGNDTPE
jgi:hypothetical protein